MKKSWIAGLTALTLALITSSACAEMVLWMRPVSASDPTTVLNNTSWDVGSTDPAPSVTINNIPTTPQTITFQLYAAIHGTNTVISDDTLAAATFDLLNFTVPGRAGMSGVPSIVALEPGVGSGIGPCPGVLASTDLTGDALQDIGGPRDAGAVPSSAGPYIRPYNVTGRYGAGAIASIADPTWTNLPIGTFTYTYGGLTDLGQPLIAAGEAAQLQTLPINFPNPQLPTFMAAWRQDGVSKADYSGYAGSNVLAGPAVTISVAGQSDDSKIVVKVNPAIGADGTDGKAGIVVDFGRVMKAAPGSTQSQIVVLHNIGVQSSGAFTATATGAATATAASPIAKDTDGDLTIGLKTDTAGDFTSGSAVIIANTKTGGSLDHDDTIAVKGTVVTPRMIETNVTVAPPNGCANFLKGVSLSDVTVGSSTGFVTNPRLKNPDNSLVAPDSSGNYLLHLPAGLKLTGDASVSQEVRVEPEGLANEPAYGTNNTLTLNIASSVANVGKALVGSKNPDNTWNLGAPLGASVALGADLAGLSSSVEANAATGALATTATILAGTTTAAGTVTMAWRNRNPSEIHAASLPTGARFTPASRAAATAASAPAGVAATSALISALAAGTATTDSLDAMTIKAETGSEGTAVFLDSLSDVSIASLDPTEGNTSGGLTLLAAPRALHSGSAAVVPEPGTITLLAAALLGLAVLGLRRRKA